MTHDGLEGALDGELRRQGAARKAAERAELRDRFALASPLEGFEITDIDACAEALQIDPPAARTARELHLFSARAIAAYRYMMADAMLAARGDA